ncbi:flagellar basal body P-ring formation chaperone FlgA [Telmatospirillum sp. J64-1]|uniref:flagellar basal body P-ring formation chaperone FlgA n=1 Tax=Telmatospirillum sp. J64-1 TaxID=2502183 RepID=UPI00115F4975|nr:flagellar basal body P-ring formation chaperone FlgA [Telmatospirillum sp. J64-1]
MRRFALAFGLATALLGTAASAAAQEGLRQLPNAGESISSGSFQAPPMLKPSATIEGDLIRLGDLFENAGDKADTPIAHAPHPGKRVVLDARWLASVAHAHGLPWQPSSAYERTVVDRASVEITRERIEEEVLAALTPYGIGINAQLEINQRDLQLYVPAEAPNSLAVRDLNFDPRSRRFVATIEAPADSPDAQRLRLAGRVHDMTEVPVLTRTIDRGQVVRETDIAWIPLRGDALRQGLITEAADMIGMEARQTLRPHQPLRRNELQRPVLVGKGSMVTMTLQAGGMTLTAQGRAIDNGGAGDTIRVTNVSSNITVEARIEGPGLVSVMPAGPVLLAN